MISSTFAFQANKWLSDIAPEILTESQRARLPLAKIKAAKREEIEAAIPHHLLYVKGWPVAIPTFEEATLIAETRRRIAELMQIDVQYTTALSISKRYAELIRLKEQKERTTKSTRKPRRDVRTQNTNAPSQPRLFNYSYLHPDSDHSAPLRGTVHMSSDLRRIARMSSDEAQRATEPPNPAFLQLNSSATQTPGGNSGHKTPSRPH